MSYRPIARLSDLWSGEIAGARAGAKRILLVNLEGTVHAYEDRCAHLGQPLSCGRLVDGNVLVCPAHAWRYDAETGSGLNPRSASLTRIPVRVIEGSILVDLKEDGGTASPGDGDVGDSALVEGRNATVGPILAKGRTAEAVIGAIRRLNAEVSLLDRGSYIRVGAPGRCIMTRAAVEEILGGPFRMPGDLEKIMPSSQGRLEISESEARWLAGGDGPEERFGAADPDPVTHKECSGAEEESP